jgi:hypothetical protein
MPASRTDHPCALEIDEGHGVDGGDAFDLERGDRVRANQGTALLRREGVANVDGDIANHGRLHGLRVNHLGAEIGEFHGLVVRELIDDLSIRHQARIRRQHPVDIGPDDDFGGIEQCTEYGP